MTENFEAVDRALWVRIDALGEDASQAQQERIVQWAVENYGPVYWEWVADQFLFGDLTHAYTAMRERVGEGF